MIFQLIQTNLSILGISKTQSVRSFRKKAFIGCLILGAGLIFHIKYLYSEANDFKQTTESIFISSVTVFSFWCYISLIHKRDELIEFIELMENLFNLFRETLNDEYPNALPPVIRAVQLVEKGSKIIYLVVTFATPICFLLPKYFYCMCCYYLTGRDAFELMDHVAWIPFDWKNPMGYSIATAILLTTMTYTLFVIANLAAFGIGAFLVGIVVTNEIENVLQIANERVGLKAERSLAMKRYKELIKWHSLVKQLITDFSNLFQPLFLAAFIWSVIAICIVMLLVQLEITQHELNSMTLVVSFVDVSYAFGLLFVVCELCQQFTNGFNKMNDTIGQFSWLKFPIEVQRFLVIVILFSQQPVDFKVFGSITCSRESFKNVANNAFSYFMVIREFF